VMLQFMSMRTEQGYIPVEWYVNHPVNTYGLMVIGLIGQCVLFIDDLGGINEGHTYIMLRLCSAPNLGDKWFKCLD